MNSLKSLKNTNTLDVVGKNNLRQGVKRDKNEIQMWKESVREKKRVKTKEVVCVNCSS